MSFSLLPSSPWDRLERLRAFTAKDVEERVIKIYGKVDAILAGAGFRTPHAYPTSIEENGPTVFAYIADDAVRWYAEQFDALVEDLKASKGNRYADAISDAVNVLSAAAACLVLIDEAHRSRDAQGNADPDALARSFQAYHELGCYVAILATAEVGAIFDAGEFRDLRATQRAAGKEARQKADAKIQGKKSARMNKLIEAYETKPPRVGFEDWCRRNGVAPRTMRRYLDERGIPRPQRKSGK